MTKADLIAAVTSVFDECDTLAASNASLATQLAQAKKALADATKPTPVPTPLPLPTPPAPTPAPLPAPAPAPAKETILRADTPSAVRAAITAGATRIQTAGLKIVDVLDCHGVPIDDLGGNGNNCMIWLDGGSLLNTTLTSPKRIAIYVGGGAAEVRDVSIANGAHLGVQVARKATAVCCGLQVGSTYDYGAYAEPGASLTLQKSNLRPSRFVGGAQIQGYIRAESAKAMVLTDVLVDDSMGGNAALRGDAELWTLTRVHVVGITGIHKLPGDNGGQTDGAFGWMIDGRGFWEIPLFLADGKTPEPRRVAAKTMFIGLNSRGVKLADAVRKTFMAITAPAERLRLRRENGLSDKDVALTLAGRAAKIVGQSNFIATDSIFDGYFMLAGRLAGTARNCDFRKANVFSHDPEPSYPWPPELAYAGEAQPGPQILFDQSRFAGGIVLDRAQFPGVTIR